MADIPDPAARLDPAAREILDDYIRARESRSFYRGLAISVSAILTSIAMIGGAFLYIKDASVDRSRSEVTRLFQDYRDTVLDSELAQVREETEKQRELFDNLRTEISATYSNVIRTSQQVESLHEKAQRALEGLNKGEGSLVFAQEIIKLRSDILELKARRDGAVTTQPARDSVHTSTPSADEASVGDRPLDGIFNGDVN